MNKRILGIGAIAIVAAILITASSISTDDVSAKTRHDRGYSQSAAITNVCPAFQDDDNQGNQAGLNRLATLATNCNW